jgi:hypothetical protein
MSEDIVDRLLSTGEPLAREAAYEIERLDEICTNQAMILRRMAPDRFPDTYFIHSGLGQKDKNGMPEKLLVVPAYGVDFSYVYEYNGVIVTTEW